MHKDIEAAVAHLEESRRKAKLTFTAALLIVLAIATAFYYAALEYSTNREELKALRAEMQELREQTEQLQSESESFKLRTQASFNDMSQFKQSFEALALNSSSLDKALYVAEKYLQKAPLNSEELRVMQTSLEDHSDSGSSHLLQGIHFLDEKDFTVAKREFDKASQFPATKALAKWGLGRVMLDSKQFEQAIEVFTDLVATADDSIRYGVLVDRGLTWVRLTDVESNLYKALADYKSAIAIGERYPTVYRRRGLVLLRMGEVEHARRDFEKAVNLSINDVELASALENIGLIYLQEKQWKKAIENSRFVAQIYPESTWNWSIQAIAAANDKRQEMQKCAVLRWIDSGGSPNSSMHHYVLQEQWQLLSKLYTSHLSLHEEGALETCNARADSANEKLKSL
ncbi:tetratricopeptide repeat protein [Alteromonas flava]|uniref:tetratricopeptide repeat protein n=1 Tax=Alteromonas flava TaxID=2048003 RepID=UPI000C284A9D|nr:tetratricopeptide repeat protein [Alteromonas flava]